MVVCLTPVLWGQNDAQNLINAGDKLFRERKYNDAYKCFEKANKELGDKSSQCLLKMAFAKFYTGDESGSLKLADRSIAAAGDAHERADAYGIKGEILLNTAGDNQKKLTLAEQAFRDAMKEDPAASIFQMKLGVALLRQNKVEEGKAALRGYLEEKPNAPNAETIQRWIKFPGKVRYPVAPEFSVTTIDGQEIATKSLAGKVIVIDFWATWCPPCRASVPEIKELTQKYPAEKLVIISVSSDNDQEHWKEFVSSKRMTWPQYIDSDHHMTKLFDVHAFPTYIIIDGDGFIRERFTSFDPQASLAFRLKEPLQKLLE